jgi:hypothetical protein
MAWMQKWFYSVLIKPFSTGDCNQQSVPWPTPERHNQLERKGERPKQPG